MGCGKNETGLKSPGVIKEIGINTLLSGVADELVGVKGSWPSLHNRITKGTIENK
jgi:hypothetical protein